MADNRQDGLLCGEDASSVPTLICIRGNSGSGKTTTAREVRRRYGRGCALLEQDHLRREVLHEHGGGPAAPAFIVSSVRTLLSLGYHVVLEGILDSPDYGGPLRDLIADHDGPAYTYYFDVSFEETVRRHQGRAEPIPVTAGRMRGWYQRLDLLGVPGERVLPESRTFAENVAAILATSALLTASHLTYCPATCPRCVAAAEAAEGQPPIARAEI